MAVINLTTSQGGVASLPYKGENKILRCDITVDCAVNNIGSTDTAKLFFLPAYTKPLLASCRVITAEGGTATADLGITGGIVDALLDGVNLNSVGISDTQSSGSSLGELAIQTSDYYLSLLANNALDAAKFTITVFVLDFRT